MSIKLGKPQLKALKIIASQLPSINSASTERHLMTGEEILMLDTITEIDGKPINPEQKYLMRFPVLMVNNHYRRLKKAWYDGGRERVQFYMTTVARIAAEHEAQQQTF